MKQKKKSPIALFLFLIFLIIFVASVLYAVQLIRKGVEEQAVYDELAEEIGASSGDHTKQKDLLKKYKKLYKKNNDFVGWLTVPGTEIDYPVMQTKDEPEYYLRRNFYKEYASCGTPFVGEGCDPDSNSFIIYGHNMKNSKMFGTLDYYADKTFWESNPVFEFNTMDECRRYQVLAAFQTRIFDTDESGFRYYEFSGNLNEDEFNEFMRSVSEAALYQTAVSAQYGDQILMLSTCSYHTDSGRFVVVSKRIE